MNITLEEWLEIDAQAKAAREALDNLTRTLDAVLLTHIRDEQIIGFISTIEDRLADARFIANSLRLQSEWLGDDSSLAENHGLREPNALSIVGLIPHLIDGSRGRDTGG